MPKQLQSLFITILILGEPRKPDMLWEKYRDTMSEDLMREYSTLTHISTEDMRKHVYNDSLDAARRP